MRKITFVLVVLIIFSSFSFVALADDATISKDWIKTDKWDGNFKIGSDGKIKISDSAWFTQRAYKDKLGKDDVVLEMSIVPGQDTWFGFFARVAEPSTLPDDMDKIKGVRIRVADLKTDFDGRVLIQGVAGLSGAESDGTTTPTPDLKPGQEIIIRAYYKGGKVVVWINDMNEPIAQIEDNGDTGEYAGVYVAHGNEAVVNYIKVNGNLISGKYENNVEKMNNGSNPDPKKDSNPDQTAAPDKTDSTSKPTASEKTNEATTAKKDDSIFATTKASETKAAEKESNNLPLIIGIIVAVVVFAGVVIFIIIKKKKDGSADESTTDAEDNNLE